MVSRATATHQKALARAAQRIRNWTSELQLLQQCGYILVARTSEPQETEKGTLCQVFLVYNQSLDQRPEEERHEVREQATQDEFTARRLAARGE